MANVFKSSAIKNGSSILFIILLVSVLTIFLSVVFKTTLYVTDFISEQEHFLRARVHYKSLQQYVLSYIRQNFDKIQKRMYKGKKPFELSFAWPPVAKTIQKTAYVKINFIADSILEFFITYKPSPDEEFKTNGSLQKIMLANDQFNYKIINWQPNL